MYLSIPSTNIFKRQICLPSKIIKGNVSSFSTGNYLSGPHNFLPATPISLNPRIPTILIVQKVIHSNPLQSNMVFPRRAHGQKLRRDVLGDIFVQEFYKDLMMFLLRISIPIRTSISRKGSIDKMVRHRVFPLIFIEIWSIPFQK